MTPDLVIAFDATGMRGASAETTCAVTANFFGGVAGEGDLATGIEIRLRNGTRLLCVIDTVSEAGVPRVRLHFLPATSPAPRGAP
jgi:hypothetical protein